MKKLFTLLTAALLGLSTMAVKAQSGQQSAMASKQTTHTTKSGAPDKRYKANKAKEDHASSPAAVPATPTKKDGTMDMRYKANKGKNKTTIKHK